MSLAMQLLSVVAFFLLTLGTAFFVAAEFALAALEKSAVDTRAASGDARDRAVKSAHHNLSLQLSACQVGITITTLITGYLAEPLIARLLEPALHGLGVPERWSMPISLGVALVLAAYLSMVIGELVPKNFAITDPTRVARMVSLPLVWFTRIFRPFIALMDNAANRIVRRLGISPVDENAARSNSELGALVRNSAREGSLDVDTAVILERSLLFGDLSAEDIMTPRSTVVSLNADDTVAALVRTAAETGYSRFPVTSHGLDETTGMVHIKQALGVPESEHDTTRLASIARPVHRVPDSLDGDSVLNRIRTDGGQMLLVMDEYGGVAGLVTLEDVVEEIVGEVVDEYDDAADLRPIVRRGAWWESTGLARLDEVARETGYHAPDGPYETIAGLVIASLGRMPHVGDVVELPTDTRSYADDFDAGHFNRWKAMVTALDGRRIDGLVLGPNVEASHPDLVSKRKAELQREQDDAEPARHARDAEARRHDGGAR